jgi:hypothetical protein
MKIASLRQLTFDHSVSLSFSERFQHGSHDHSIKKSQEPAVHLRAKGVESREKGEAYLRNDFGVASVHV